MQTLKRLGRRLVILGLVLGPALLVLWQGHNILDWIKLHNYNPPSAVVTLASQDSMTPYGRRMFYVNHPQVISDIPTFRQDCSESEQAIVLGCYQPGESGIFIFNPNDPRLNGVQQVTVAHETLHAAYERLSTKDRDYVDGLLMDYYKHDLTNNQVINEIKLYQKTEPNDVVNEMHSVFGTEIAHLPSPLEKYYQRYFANRQKVVSFGQKYQSEFDSREAAVKADDAQLASLRTTITSEESQLQIQLNQLNSDRSKLDAERSSSPSQYNSDVDSFNAKVDSYNAGVAKLKLDISTFNQLVVQRNAVAKSLASLESSIDTRLNTQAAQ